MGGLILHWAVTIGLIVAATRINNMLDAASFPGLLQTYGHAAVLIPRAIGFLRLRSRAEALHFNINELQRPLDRFSARLWHERSSRKSLTLLAIVLACICLNAFLIIGCAIPPYGDVDGWILLVIVGSLVLFATAYYVALFSSSFPKPKLEKSQANEDGIPDPQVELEKSPWGLLAVADVKVDVNKWDDYQADRSYAERFASRRNITYEVSDLCRSLAPLRDLLTGSVVSQNGNSAFFLYWFFGGGNLNYDPWKAAKESWRRLKG